MAMKIILKSQNGNHSFPEIAKRRTPGLDPEKAPFVRTKPCRLVQIVPSPEIFQKLFHIWPIFCQKISRTSRIWRKINAMYLKK